MKQILENEEFDIKIEPSDWRYSATIVGLFKYLLYIGDEDDYEIADEYIKFRSRDITEDKFLQFVEYQYKDELHHKKLENLLLRLEQPEAGEPEVEKVVNDLLKGNSIMKKIFGKLKYTGDNKDEILSYIQIHRSELIKETFRNKSNLYANYANTGQLFSEEKPCCRLVGYYVDGGRKTKSTAYRFDTSSSVSKDDPLFDFIPFAFFGDRESFFINDNYTVQRLIDTNLNFKHFVETSVEAKEKKYLDTRKILFQSIQEASDFIDYDVEIIKKSRDEEFFETLFIRKESINILRKLKVYDPFCFSLKITDKYYINVQEKVMDCILNLLRTDEIIELLLKQPVRTDWEYLISRLILLNQLICKGGVDMKQTMKVAYACAKEAAGKLPENKRTSYRQKLTSAVVFKDYDRYCQVLMQLSNYVNMPFDFAYALFEDFEQNKDIAYTFINALGKKDSGEGKK